LRRKAASGLEQKDRKSAGGMRKYEPAIGQGKGLPYCGVIIPVQLHFGGTEDGCQARRLMGVGMLCALSGAAIAAFSQTIETRGEEVR
jgi:hypothetical protein